MTSSRAEWPVAAVASLMETEVVEVMEAEVGTESVGVGCEVEMRVVIAVEATALVTRVLVAVHNPCSRCQMHKN